jgi:type IV secretory pathway VirB10-like protein
MQGLTQALMGLIIITLVGVAMVATLVSTAADSSDLRKTIITALLSVLATIAGFYFGARTAQISSEQATRPPSPAGRPQGAPPEPPAGPPPEPPAGPPADQKTAPEENEPPAAPSAGKGEAADEEPASSEAQGGKEESAGKTTTLTNTRRASEKDQPQ